MDSVDAIRRDSDAFYAAAEKADPSTQVPSCPDWNIGDLVYHLGDCHSFWALDIETRGTDPEELEKQKADRPASYRDVIAYGRAQADRLLAALESNADDVHVWTWALDESEHNVGFIRRHQVQEAAVHRWDIQNAMAPGQADPIDAEAAADSIDEVLAITLPWGARPDKPLPGTVHLHCTDTDGEWFIHTDGRVEPIHAKGDVAIRGTASDLLLALYTRQPLDAVDVIGDESVAREFVARINTG